MPTIDEIRQKIKRNFPKETQSRREALKPLTWNLETGTTMTSSCGRFRIAKHTDGKDTFEYMLYTIPSPTVRSRKIAGPFVTAKECRDAAQDYVNGEPMQADLS